MSRIGKNPVVIPAGVQATLSGRTLTVKGPKGVQTMEVHPDIACEVKDNQIVFTRPSDDPAHRALHGTNRALAHNMVVGVSEGFAVTLDLVGVGYRVEPAGKNINLVLGFSHPVPFEAPEGVSFKVETPNRLVISGADKQAVGQVAAVIRKYRPPEPYKGKGILFAGEHVRRKAGKRTGK